MVWRYLIALGSNVRHVRHGQPEQVLAAALTALDGAGITVLDVAPTIRSAALGPAHRRYANTAAVVECPLEPDALLARLKQLERAFGRRARGQRWAARVLDLDLVLWQGGAWSSPGLTVPHAAFRERAFVLGPAQALAAQWRDPLTGLTLRQLHARLRRRLTRPAAAPR